MGRRLIDTDAAYAVLTDYYHHTTDTQHAALREALGRVESVDAVPVRYGRWKEDPSGYGFWICSACGFVSEASAADMLYKFCPVCGAKMDGEDGDHEKAD